MKHYELLFVFKPTLTEEEVSAKVDFIKEILTKNGAEITSLLSLGTRKLAYTVKKHERGVFFVAYFTAPTVAIAEVERIIRINEDIIKFLTVKFENKKEVAAWERLSKGIKQSKKEPKPKAEETPSQEA
ncbi:MULTISPECIES: 30S ribosomal protein S6 [unclassified Campylobacter]|uniref:30S ribosomal protein S6 n=1 Tax=Campylobacter TaxID=194 RepID=UPI0014760AE4|nr:MULTISPECIES: 30S ribosomal protein S6 [unclassified Campylobacter]QKF92454.1 30S ribosomal protein S6 [Campylobacter sp. CCUG 57310]